MILVEASALQAAVQSTIDEGRIGKPQFLRCIAQVADRKDLGSALSELVSLADGWFDSSSTQRHKPDDGMRSYLTEMRKWPGGQGAIFTVSSTPLDGMPHLDLMLVGSKGTLYHET